MGAKLNAKKLHNGKLNGKNVLGKKAGRQVWEKDQPSLMRVQTIAPLQIARRDPQGVTIPYGAMFAGGFFFADGESNFENATYSAAVDFYTNTFVHYVLQDLSVARFASGAAYNGNYILIGGSRQEGVGSVDRATPTIPLGAGIIDIYDENLTRLTPKQYNVMRVFDTVVSSGEYIFIAGGYTFSYESSSVVEMFDSAMTHAFAADIPVGTWASRPGKWRGQGVVFGGRTGDLVAPTDNSIYKITWTDGATQEQLPEPTTFQRKVRNGRFLYFQPPGAAENDPGVRAIMRNEDFDPVGRNANYCVNEKTGVVTVEEYVQIPHSWSAYGVVDQGRGQIGMLQDLDRFLIATVNWGDDGSETPVTLKTQEYISATRWVSRNGSGSATQSPYLMIAGGAEHPRAWLDMDLTNVVEIFSTNYREIGVSGYTPLD